MLSGAQAERLRGVEGMRASALSDVFDAVPIGPLDSDQHMPTSSSPTQLWSPFDSSSAADPSLQHLHLHQTDSAERTPNKLDLTPHEAAARQGMLADSFFPALKNDAHGADMDTPEQMQKNDPLATQIWKLYSKARTQLPNAERMENLTWRMMAMSMRRAERDRNKGYERRHVQLLTSPPAVSDPNSRRFCC